MNRLRAVALICSLGLFSLGSGVFSQDKGDKADTKPEGKVRGQLPPNWGKLGLTDEQKQKSYKIIAKYREQIDELKAKITKLQEEEKGELQTVLTAEQKKRLLEIKTGEKMDKDDKKDKDK